MLNMEKGGSISQSARDFFKILTPAGVGVAIAATLCGEGPVFLLLKLLKDANLTSSLAISWLTIIFIIAGIFSIFCVALLSHAHSIWVLYPCGSHNR